MDRIGVMQIPPDFKYLDVYRKGKPAHDRYDSFSIRHPSMKPGQRAKIFAPFDALRGFHFAILSKEVSYVDKPELSCEEVRALNFQLARLRELTRNSRAARQNGEGFWRGSGQYRKGSGSAAWAARALRA